MSDKESSGNTQDTKTGRHFRFKPVDAVVLPLVGVCLAAEGFYYAGGMLLRTVGRTLNAAIPFKRIKEKIVDAAISVRDGYGRFCTGLSPNKALALCAGVGAASFGSFMGGIWLIGQGGAANYLLGLAGPKCVKLFFLYTTYKSWGNARKSGPFQAVVRGAVWTRAALSRQFPAAYPRFENFIRSCAHRGKETYTKVKDGFRSAHAYTKEKIMVYRSSKQSALAVWARDHIPLFRKIERRFEALHRVATNGLRSAHAEAPETACTPDPMPSPESLEKKRTTITRGIDLQRDMTVAADPSRDTLMQMPPASPVTEKPPAPPPP